MTDSGRITALEVQVHDLVSELRETNKKLDQLLELKNKAAGAFWLVSIIAGSGLIGFVVSAIEWLRG